MFRSALPNRKYVKTGFDTLDICNIQLYKLTYIFFKQNLESAKGCSKCIVRKNNGNFGKRVRLNK